MLKPHITQNKQEENQVPLQVVESLSKFNLHEPQQDRQKHQQKPQQTQHYLP